MMTNTLAYHKAKVNSPFYKAKRYCREMKRRIDISMRHEFNCLDGAILGIVIALCFIGAVVL